MMTVENSVANMVPLLIPNTQYAIEPQYAIECTRRGTRHGLLLVVDSEAFADRGGSVFVAHRLKYDLDTFPSHIAQGTGNAVYANL